VPEGRERSCDTSSPAYSTSAGGSADPALAAGLDHLRPGLDFLEDAGDLFFRETRLLHAEFLGVELHFQLDRIYEDASLALPSNSPVRREKQELYRGL
jgi:hypothetical protein